MSLSNLFFDNDYDLFSNSITLDEINANSQPANAITVNGDLNVNGDITGNNLGPGTDLVPNLDNTYNIGDPTKRWKDLYTLGNSYLPNITTQSGNLSINPVGSIDLNNKDVVNINSLTRNGADLSISTLTSGDINLLPVSQIINTNSSLINASGMNNTSADLILSTTTSGNIELSSAANINCTGLLNIDFINSKTINANLTLSGNGIGVVEISDGLKLPTTGGTQGTLSYYEVNTFIAGTTIKAETCFASAQNTNGCYFTKIGNLVTAQFPSFAATSGSANPMDITGIPARFSMAGANNRFGSCIVRNAGSDNTLGMFRIENNGQNKIRLYVGSGLNFTIGTSCGFPDGMTLIYNVDN